MLQIDDEKMIFWLKNNPLRPSASSRTLQLRPYEMNYFLNDFFMRMRMKRVDYFHISDAWASSPAHSLYLDETYSTKSVLNSGSRSISNIPEGLLFYEGSINVSKNHPFVFGESFF